MILLLLLFYCPLAHSHFINGSLFHFTIFHTNPPTKNKYDYCYYCYYYSFNTPEYFNVYSNQFSGTIPNDLRWRQCVQFDVGRNLLTGTLPKDLGEKFVNLRMLHLDHNKFRGTLPANYNNVGNGRLVALSLEYNRLTGMVPGEREIYDNLVQYTLHENRFTSLGQENCNNNLMVEFKADCPNVCTCFGRFFTFCERWCGYNDANNNNNNNPSRNPNFDSNPNINNNMNNNNNWQQVQQRPPWQQQVQQQNNPNNNWQQQQQQQQQQQNNPNNWQQRPQQNNPNNWAF